MDGLVRHLTSNSTPQAELETRAYFGTTQEVKRRYDVKQHEGPAIDGHSKRSGMLTRGQVPFHITSLVEVLVLNRVLLKFL